LNYLEFQGLAPTATIEILPFLRLEGGIVTTLPPLAARVATGLRLRKRGLLALSCYAFYRLPPAGGERLMNGNGR
jgi:hypothetical protein